MCGYQPTKFYYFYPRSPCGERRGPFGRSVLMVLFLSTLSLRRATPSYSPVRCCTPNFYPRSPCGERRLTVPFPASRSRFLSTLSLRRATCTPWHPQSWAGYFYPRSPCGERPIPPLVPIGVSPFLSTLSLRRATSWMPSANAFPQFLSTLSLRRATPSCKNAFGYFCISIHALLAESDAVHHGCRCHSIHYFYPRSPCGERPIPRRGRAKQSYFYPRSPCGERRYTAAAGHHSRAISIHALLAESDVATVGLNLVGQIFLSTLSLRRATGAKSRTPERY